MQKVLVVEDDPILRDVLRFNLSKEGYTVLQASTGPQGLSTARREQPDLILLDIMLPEMSGLEICRILRQESRAAIILLTAKSEEVDKIVGLEIGADDYLTKPFSMKELLARVRAQLRRWKMATSATTIPLKIAGLDIDTARHVVKKGNAVLNLSPKEFELLAFMSQNQGLVFSREQLLEKIWGYEYAGNTRTVDVHIRWLRQKIEDDPAKPRYLITVRGTGYKLES